MEVWICNQWPSHAMTAKWNLHKEGKYTLEYQIPGMGKWEGPPYLFIFYSTFPPGGDPRWLTVSKQMVQCTTSCASPGSAGPAYSGLQGTNHGPRAFLPLPFNSRQRAPASGQTQGKCHKQRKNRSSAQMSSRHCKVLTARL